MSKKVIVHKFVDAIPEKIEDRTLYISIEFATAVHKCCCGCGQEVVTPLSPTDWKLIYDGETVSLNPSIGNWSFVCRSHYWIDRNKIKWAAQWTDEQIAAGRLLDQRAKDAYFERERTTGNNYQHKTSPPGLIGRIKKWLLG